MKRLLIMGCLLIALYFIIKPWPEPTMLEIVESYEDRWGVPLPEPQRFEKVWATKIPARGDGEWYSVMHYEQELPEPNDANFIEITAQNETVISGKVNRFIANTIDTHLSDQETQTAIREAFDEHPVEFSVGDYYFHQAENGGYDYIIGVYSQAYKKVYLMEWHQ